MVSIIVPIFNASAFLRRTLKSITDQTFTDFEVIMIDDGSTDDSAEICKLYVEKDKRFNYFFKSNSGVSDARNLGLNKSIGNYIAFLDADDTYEKLFLEKLVDLITTNKTISIAVCDITVIDKDGKKVCSDFKIEQKAVIMTDYEFCAKQNFLGAATLWNKIYRKEVFENLRFPSGLLFEDNYVFHEIFGNLKYSLVLLNEYLYNYHHNSSSITRKQLTFGRYKDYIKGLTRRFDFFTSNPVFSCAASQTKNLILYEIVQNFISNEIVRNDLTSRKFLSKFLLTSNVHYKTKALVFLKLFLSSISFKSRN
ncbi:glycosyltransferase family 2 protein [Halpernia frigidisoli]|uniref:Glycosyltransferase involved in cell wall bisynthesis n=1 Tax=Halpernia frigidisoli TaxID=1125876 RepID=A0A1I3FEN2_9FLAO|nr:glycosyltransferase family 2 protein [Halpernia frigidisoli]SFI09689.1 Glycosyltransferase involved in cell wall bisynthesis [Halpernia frigidisoli]